MNTVTMGLNDDRYSTLIKACAVYDILVTTVVALPMAVAPILGMLAQLDSMLGFNSQFISVDATTTFLLNLAGCYVTVWAIYRFKYPSVTVGKLDAILRFVLAALQVVAVLNGATPILLGIALMLLLMAAAEWFLTPEDDL